MRARKALFSGLIMALVLGLVACGNGGDDDNVLGGAGTADLVVDDERPFYEPTELKLPLNREVTFTVFNKGDELHNIVIPGFDVDMDVAADSSVEITLPATSAPPRDGFYTVYCKYHQHLGESLRLEVLS